MTDNTGTEPTAEATETPETPPPAQILWKWTISRYGSFTLGLPPSAKFSHFDNQKGSPTAWFLCDANDTTEVKPARFVLVETGESFDPYYVYLGTCMDGESELHLLVET